MNPLAGIAITILSAVSYGTLGIFGKLAYAEGLTTTTLLFFRFFFTAIVLMATLFIRKQELPKGKTLLVLVLMGSVGFSGQAFSYLTALKYASAGVVAILLSLYPAFVSIITTFVLKKKISNIAVLGIGISFIGTVLIADPAGGNITGFLFGITAALIYSVYIVTGSQVMHKVTALQSSAVIFSSTTVVYFFLILMERPILPTGFNSWAIIFGMVLIPTILASVTFLEGLKRIGPVNASLISTIEPLVTVLLSFLIFGEKLGVKTILGGALILGAVVMFTASNKK
jgi:drug/metabolite transporter (DMT)-like permease